MQTHSEEQTLQNKKSRSSPVEDVNTTRDSIRDIWGERSPFEGEGAWPVRVDQRVLEEPDHWVQSACVLCSNGCGCDIAVKEGRIVGVRGRAEDVVNRGRMGPKGLHGWEANNSKDRLLHPLIRRLGKLQKATWDEAMDLIVQKSKEIQKHFTSSAIGFYTSGQLFLEEYYTLGVIGKAGLGTPHMDGNTRLCTATAAAALKETFGSDGQPGSYYDLDVTDCILMVGHNMASTDTVLWMRTLDRRRSANPPRLIVVDPRSTPTAKEADLHLAPRLGTNVALFNGLLCLLIEGNHIDSEFLAKHTIGFEDLKKVVCKYNPEKVEEITGVPTDQLKKAAEMIGNSQMLLSTCLQGVYQSNQATAAAVQINNLNLILGRIGKPGCGILQMNGQPTSENTRESGADGDLPAFRNWENPKHIENLAKVWNVDKDIIPHWTPPTHALQIIRHCETGKIQMLWIQATNPAVSLPDLARIRSILTKPDLFVIVQDPFLTETAQLADVVLPTAIWGEKTGTFTNVDRTVHISHKAVEAPGEAKSDFEIFVDYARRMEFKDKDGKPLIKWTCPEEAFEAWKECTKGFLCDYTGLSYEKLSAGSGIPWPCNEQYPNGKARIYHADQLVFPTDPEVCESYGHDLITGAAISPTKYRALNPAGRAILKPAEYNKPFEVPDANYPFFLTTGRLVYHFHTRTKTGRSKDLQKAAPDNCAQISSREAERLKVQDGDWVRVTSRRGFIEVPIQVGDIKDGEVFVSFHFGYWDQPGRSRAANELTIYEWDPVSKQPHFKYAAVKIEKISGPQSKQPENMDPESVGKSSGSSKSTIKELKSTWTEKITGHKPMPYLADYLGLLRESEIRISKGFNQVKDTHPDEPDISSLSALLASWSDESVRALEPFVKRYGEKKNTEPERLDRALLVQRKQGGFDLLRDLHDMWLVVNESLVSIDVLAQAAQALRDEELKSALEAIRQQNQRQLDWIRTRLRHAAPQILVVP